jgi:hypothetical protein
MLLVICAAGALVALLSVARWASGVRTALRGQASLPWGGLQIQVPPEFRLVPDRTGTLLGVMPRRGRSERVRMGFQLTQASGRRAPLEELASRCSTATCHVDTLQSPEGPILCLRLPAAGTERRAIAVCHSNRWRAQAYYLGSPDSLGTFFGIVSTVTAVE